MTLVELLTDAEARDAILDDPRLFETSARRRRAADHFAAALLLRFDQACLERDRLDDRRVSDYVASLLEAFSQTARMQSPADGQCQPDPVRLATCSSRCATRRRRRPSSSARTSAITRSSSPAFFTSTVQSRSQRGAPDVGFYEDVGSASNSTRRRRASGRALLRAERRVRDARRGFPRRAARAEPALGFAAASRRSRPPPLLLRMNATLFSEIQRLFERTYAQVGINLEDCLIDRQRCGQLSRAAGASARELSELARTFLRQVGRPALRRHLLLALADRAARAARSAQGNQRREYPVASSPSWRRSITRCTRRCSSSAGCARFTSEDFARNLELQAQVDTYLVLLLFVAFFRKTQKVSRTDRRWLRFHLFVAARRRTPTPTPNLRGRYLETTELADAIHAFPRRAQRRAARGRDPHLSRAGLRGKKAAHPRADGQARRSRPGVNLTGPPVPPAFPTAPSPRRKRCAAA